MKIRIDYPDEDYTLEVEAPCYVRTSGHSVEVVRVSDDKVQAAYYEVRGWIIEEETDEG